MQRGFGVLFLKLDHDLARVHDVFAIGVTDGRNGVGSRILIGWEAKGFESRGDVGVFDEFGLVRYVLIVEHHASWGLFSLNPCGGDGAMGVGVATYSSKGSRTSRHSDLYWAGRRGELLT